MICPNCRVDSLNQDLPPGYEKAKALGVTVLDLDEGEAAFECKKCGFLYIIEHDELIASLTRLDLDVN